MYIFIFASSEPLPVKKAYIVSSLYAVFVDQCYNTKFMYSDPLCDLINVDTSYFCKIVIIMDKVFYFRLLHPIQV